MTAFVQIITRRGRNIGYGVYDEWKKDGQTHGRCLHVYRWSGGKSLRNCDTWEIALHLANKHRDDFNAGCIGDAHAENTERRQGSRAACKPRQKVRTDMTKARRSIEPMRHINGNIRAKQAPDVIRTAKEALEALRRERQYRTLGSDALAIYYKAGNGTHTAHRHYERYEKYDEVADDWLAVLVAWLEAQCAPAP